MLKARFNDGRTDSHLLLEYSSPTNDDDTIVIMQKVLPLSHGTLLPHATNVNVNTLKVIVKVSGVKHECSATSSSATLNKVHTYKFGVDTEGLLWATLDGASVLSCPGTSIPSSTVARNHYLGKGTYTSLVSHVDELNGAILGLSVKNTQESPDFLKSYKFLNLPGQPYGYSFVASFYARFDSIGTASYQRVFDFWTGEFNGLGEVNNNIWCGQVWNLPEMACEFYQEGVRYRIGAPKGVCLLALWI